MIVIAIQQDRLTIVLCTMEIKPVSRSQRDIHALHELILGMLTTEVDVD